MDWGEIENLKAALDFSGSSEMWKAVRPAFAERTHLECFTEVMPFTACFICMWPANSPFLFVCIIINIIINEQDLVTYRLYHLNEPVQLINSRDEI